MGQKTNPISNRLHLTSNWQSKWFGGSKFREYLVSDLKIRDFLRKKLDGAGVGVVEIIRSKDRLDIMINTSKPGLVIGRGGQGINQLRAEIQRSFYPTEGPAIKIDILEDRQPEISASLVAQSIGSQIQRRIAYRRACRQALEKTMANKKAKGIRITVSGRLNGAEIARDETFQNGSLPLSRLDNHIDYGLYHAKTSYGIIGIKVWIDRGPMSELEDDAASS